MAHYTSGDLGAEDAGRGDILSILAWMYYEMIYRHPDADNNQEAFEGLWLRFERRVRALEISTLYADE